MELFQHCGQNAERLLAVTETGGQITLGELETAAEQLVRATGSHRLVFLLCSNTPGTLMGYLACLRTGVVPLLLDSHIPLSLLMRLREIYRPAFLWVSDGLPEDTRAALSQCRPLLTLKDSVLLDTGEEGPNLHPDLALLLTTSGSTGSPKLVRLTAKNLDSNARSIVKYLGVTEEERPILSLPMSYSYGMSIVNTHVMAGAAVVLTPRKALERGFWELMERERITSLAGVPYSYQMFLRAGLLGMDLPCLRTLTQAGGALSERLQQTFALWAARTGRRFFVMYGQTEASPRMSYLPPERALDKFGSIGIPIPQGAFRLEENGAVIDGPDQIGELIYYGDNVSMGYASTARDLLLGDLWQGRLATGDIARRDAEGFYYIAGRKKRFVKLCGNRVSLDEIERLLSARFPDAGFACVGMDDNLRVFHDGADPTLSQAALCWLEERLHLPSRTCSVTALDGLPKNEAGKILYTELEKAEKWRRPPQNL